MLSALRHECLSAPPGDHEVSPLPARRPAILDGGGQDDLEKPRPIVKWAGGKRRLLSQYEAHFPVEYNNYFEPFVGGAAVFFHLCPTGAPGGGGCNRSPLEGCNRGSRQSYLTDVNGELINLYKQVQKKPAPLLIALERHQAMHSKEHYYHVRSQSPSQLNPVERAARLIYLNRTCFNGLYRVNSSGGFNVPIGRYKNPTILQPERLMRAHQTLQGVKLAVEPYLKAVTRAQAGDFVYFDPPYWPLSVSSSFTSYAQGNFGESDQRSLAQIFASLAERGVKVALSNSKTPLIEELYRNFPQITVHAARCINSRGDQRNAIEELLILSQPVL